MGALPLSLALFGAPDALAQPRGSSSGRAAPALPPSGQQNEAIDLNEGKSAAELFQAGCAVCHQSPAGLAKGRREGELTSFLRQHYTSGTQHAAALAGFLAGRGGPATAATPPRQSPIERPPAPIGNRKPPAEEEPASQDPAPPDRRRKPQEASRPPDREAPAAPAAPLRRRPSEKSERPTGSARTGPQSPATLGSEAASPAGESTAPASSPPVEDKPAPPEIPL